ncbi:MAG: 2Fe-2S iron-sulfur cluster-binding protein [Nocardioidaceae bacterium]
MRRTGSAPAQMTMRLGARPGEVVERETAFTFNWNGQSYPAYDGDTIASALAACGVRIFSRSFKYHRPRGLLTADHLDPGCIVQVDDEPNVRGGHRLARSGMTVRPQDAWPSLAHDVKAANGLLSRFLGPGFYYKTFISPQPLWPTYERVLRRFAHGGEVSATPQTPAGRPRYDKRFAHPDVLVAGGGPAGIAAAVAAARVGARVVLVEEEHSLGGHLRWGGPADLAALQGLRDLVDATPGIEVLKNSVVLGRYDDNWVAVVQRGLAGSEERLIKARVKCLVVAPGLVERPYVFAGNDVPGVLLSTAVRRLVNLYAVRPGTRAVVLTANPEGDATVEDLASAGVEVVHVEDARRGGDVVRVLGRSAIKSVEVSGGKRLECDLLVTSVGWTAPVSLLTMAGDVPRYDERCALFRPDVLRLPSGVMATGGIVGDGTTDQLVAHGEATGREAANRAAQLSRKWRATAPQHSSREAPRPAPRPESAQIPELAPQPHPELFRGTTHGIVDFSEDVSSKDLFTAVAEGYSSVELAKRYTTATMGPTQGKLETVNVVAIVAEATGRTIHETGTTTWRPPYAPVTLGALAGRSREPRRISPMQPWHELHGAVPLVAGAWIRPDHYGSPESEVIAVRERVGIIDVTPIGKLDLRGPDVPRLLNLLYVNRWSKLEVGRVRYGVMCAEDGVVLDDGVTGRLETDRYLMSTTSSGAATVWEWAERWLQTEHPDWRVQVSPVTTAYASINVAGPRSRELVQRVVDDIDVSSEAFPYMAVRVGRVAGVGACVLLRIGFTGELSYELHIPASYGLHVWERLLEHGRDLGVRPFGVEAQRILRLEKGHLIVGQDTDGLTRAFSAGLEGLVKLDKDDFVGMPEVVWQRESGDDVRLVALRTADPALVPPEGTQLIDGDDRICGRITSSRMSPTLGRSVCLAQLAEHLAKPGVDVAIRLTDGGMAVATVSEHLAQVDPQGVRLRG